MYNNINTAFDVMKEFMITGAEFDGKYDIPIIPACSFDNCTLMDIPTFRKIPDELKADVSMVNYQTRNQRINERMVNK